MSAMRNLTPRLKAENSVYAATLERAEVFNCFPGVSKRNVPDVKRRVLANQLSSVLSLPSTFPAHVLKTVVDAIGLLFVLSFNFVMTHASEKFDVMDAISSYAKEGKVILSKPLALLLVVIFIAVLVATGLIVYHFYPKYVKEIVRIPCNETTPGATHFSTEIASTETEGTETTLLEITTGTSKSGVEKPDPRLPRAVIPHSYKLQLLPFIFEGNFTFRGEVLIEVNVTEPTKNITLHADELQIDETSITVFEENSSVILNITEISNDTARNFLIIHLDDALETNSNYRVLIKFQGYLNDAMQGFYRSSYTLHDQKRWLAATQFQPTDARKAFPCFDEPALKATFEITLGRLKNMSTISNMPKINSSPIVGLDDYVWDHFQKSVPMSTYLVAFVVSDLHYVKNGTLSIWARESVISQASFGLRVGPTVLKYYEDFFQIDFPLPKIDMVALPDFSTGAMENWGLITYRESVLLYEKGVSSVGDLQSIASVIAHEMAHQWFGNLVTPSWWTDLWLNEGFASYMEYLGANAACPELKILDQFVVQELQDVFQLDALKSSHPISIKVDNPSEINNIFDRISYGKGATIIRMMEDFLTTDVFKMGITNYLNERKYSNADQDDLWSALTKQAQADGKFDRYMDVKVIMDTWTLQTGFPLVTVTRGYNGGDFHFHQERFIVGGRENSTETPLWWIPIMYMTRNGHSIDKVWMKAVPDMIKTAFADDDEWLLVNLNQTGYYRVNYDERNWQLLIEELNTKDGFKKFDPKNRAQLLDDALNLAESSYINYSVALNLTKYLVHEREYVPWKTAFDELDFLYEIFVRSGQFDKFKKYFLYLIKGLYHDVGFDEEPKDSTLKIYTRSYVLWRACMVGYRDCIANAVKQFRDWRYTPDPDRHNPIAPSLRNLVYCYAIKVGGQEEWDFVWQRYLNTDVGSEKDSIMTSLGCTTETWILLRYLEWAVTEGSGIRKQDIGRVFGTVASTIIGQQLTYRFLTTNWEKIKKYIGSSQMLLAGVFEASLISYTTEQELNDVRAFVASKGDDLAFASRTIQQYFEREQVNLDWKKKHFDEIVRWLDDFNAQS